tara:strand:- start:19246 stop:19926 length:681 start_codon:yes stop_codon:yes gene_type:complete
MYNYSSKYNKESMARAFGRSMPISTKKSIEICNFIRHMNVTKAKEVLEAVIVKKAAIPFKRFNMDMGHKTGIGPGRYPIKTSQEILDLLKSAESNAISNEMNKDNLVISHISAQMASAPWHAGRQRRRKAKRTHIEVVVEEGKQSKDKKEEAKPTEQKPSISDKVDKKVDKMVQDVKDHESGEDKKKSAESIVDEVKKQKKPEKKAAVSEEKPKNADNNQKEENKK